MTKKPSAVSRQAPPPVSGGRRQPHPSGPANARGNRHAELQRELQALLQGFSRTVSSSLNLVNGLETFCEGANRVFAADRTSVWLHDRNAREMVLEASSDASYLARGGHVSTDDLLAPAAGALRRERAEIIESLPHRH